MTLRDPVPGHPAPTADDLRHLANRLRELAPDLAATHCVQSIISFYNWDFPRAEEFSRKAIQAGPDYELAHTWYGFILAHWGRTAEGRERLRTSLSLAPAKAIIYRCFGHAYYVDRDFTNAIVWYRRAFQLDQRHYSDLASLGLAYRAMGDYTNAIHWLKEADLLHARDKAAVTKRYQSLRDAFDRGGMPAYWEQELKLSQSESNKNFYADARIQSHLGNTNAALDLLDKSFATREREGFESVLAYLLFNESWDSLRNTTRFQELLDKVGFTKVMPRPKK